MSDGPVISNLPHPLETAAGAAVARRRIADGEGLRGLGEGVADAHVEGAPLVRDVGEALVVPLPHGCGAALGMQLASESPHADHLACPFFV